MIFIMHKYNICYTLTIVYFSFYEYFCELFSDHPDWDVKKEYTAENLKVIPKFLLFNYRFKYISYM